MRRAIFGSLAAALLLTILIACTPEPSREEFQWYAMKFEEKTYKRESNYRILSGYEPPPWTAEQAIDQLSFRVLVDALDDVLGAMVAVTIGEEGMVVDTIAGGGGTIWYIEVPPMDWLDVGTSRWRIAEAGGYRYDNKDAAQIATCVMLEYKAGGYGCPLD